MQQNHFDALKFSLKKAAANAVIDTLGEDLVKNEAQAVLGLSLLRIFGHRSEGFLYFEPSTARSANKPADVVLCTGTTGVVVFECKGFSSGSIERVQAGTIFLQRLKGVSRQESPLDQVRSTMFDIKNGAERRTSGSLPIFLYFVALPNYPTSEWIEKGFSESFPTDVLLLKEDLEPTQLFVKVLAAVRKVTAKCRRSVGATPNELKLIRSTFGDSALLQPERPYTRKPEETLGWMISEYSRADKDLSTEQKQLSELDLTGVPRVIRGVAGSGKSIVLANQAARFLAGSAQSDLLDNPPRKIAAICYNQAFGAHLKKSISRAFRSRTHQELPNSFFIGYLNGFVWELSQQKLGFKYLHVDKDNSQLVAKQYLAQWKEFSEWFPQVALQLQYDAIFVDEGQDLFPEEIEFLHLLVRKDTETNERPLIIFYDDAQNIYARQRPVWKELGIDVGRGNRSRVMKECFRNTKEIVTFAFNILLGSQAMNPSSVTTRAFAGLAELRQNGLVEEHEGLFRVNFAERAGEMPTVHLYDTRQHEFDFLLREISNLIENEYVDPNQILVLSLTKWLCEDASKALKSLKADGTITDFVLPASRPSNERSKDIFQDRHLTLSTVASAKGYEAYIVFLFGVDIFGPTSEGRAGFYVGATRAKSRLYISGVKNAESLKSPDTLLPELEKLDTLLGAAKQAASF